MLQESFPGDSLIGDLSQPYGGFNRLNLAKEGPNSAEIVLTPMLEQASRFRRDLPLAWIVEVAPLIQMLPHLVNEGSQVILLLLCGKGFAFIKNNLFLQ